MPPGDNIHVFVRRRFNFTSHPDLTDVGRALDDLSSLRNRADYHLSSLPEFSSAAPATQAVAVAQSKISLLDVIEADSTRRAAAVAALRAAFPGTTP
jgi:hypothetical protein